MTIVRTLVVLTAGALAVLTLEWRPASAAEGRWCAIQQIGGGGGLREDCQFNTNAECREVVLAGDRGFCTENPRWTGKAEPAAKPAKGKKPQN